MARSPPSTLEGIGSSQGVANVSEAWFGSGLGLSLYVSDCLPGVGVKRWPELRTSWLHRYCL